MRVGFGYDSHVFEAGKPLVLGGVAISGCDGLKAHSDGDVLIHAVIDALFGAAALGDIGSHFPDSDERWRGADSASLLSQTVDELARRGFRVGRCCLLRSRGFRIRCRCFLYSCGFRVRCRRFLYSRGLCGGIR